MTEDPPHRDRRPGAWTLEALLANTDDLVAVASLEDGSYPIYWLNRSGRALVGLPATGPVKVPLARLYTPDTWVHLRDEVLPGVLDGEPWHGTARLHDPGTGAVTDVDAGFFLVRDPRSGDPVCLATIERDVTERLAVARRLRATERRARRIVEQAPLGIAIADPSGRFLDVNPAFAQMLGRERDELVGMTHREVTHPDDVETSVSRLEELVAADDGSYRVDKRYLRADGATVWCRATVSLLHDADGARYLLGTIEDITERVEDRARLEQLHRDLEVRERRYRTLVDNVPGVLYRCEARPPFELRYISEPVIDLFGISASEFTGHGRELIDQLHPDDVQRLVDSIDERVRATDEPFVLEYRIVRPDGEVRWVLDRCRCVPDDTGTGHVLDGVLFDVTTQRLAERALHERDLQAREAAAEREHVRQLQLLAQAAVDVNGALDLSAALARVEAAAQDASGGAPARIDLTDGTPPDGWFVVPVTDRAGMAIGTLSLDREGTDVDERLEAIAVQLAQLAATAVERDELLRRTAEQEARRFREELLSGITHDMQTPLAAIAGLTDLLLEDPDAPPDVRVESYRVLRRQAGNLRNLVQQFLDHSRLEADRDLIVRRRPVDVGPALARTIDRFTHLRPVEREGPRDLPTVLAEEQRFEQIVGNLLSNAVKYSEGPITVRSGVDASHVTVEVVDDGVGVDPDDLEHLFAKYHRGHNSTGVPGTGIGLYVSKAVAEAMGAQLEARSDVGAGSTFRLRLVRADAPGAPPGSVEPEVG